MTITAGVLLLSRCRCRCRQALLLRANSAQATRCSREPACTRLRRRRRRRAASNSMHDVLVTTARNRRSGKNRQVPVQGAAAMKEQCSRRVGHQEVVHTAYKC
jgi:hypothetical protein